ncbi:MAG TPA: hypothetical protein VH351_15220 [Bryobacteraceae bacterium]|nr:hypothetical protein [Bryobacteraceae bacterium]
MAEYQESEKQEGVAEMTSDSVGREISGNASPHLEDAAVPAPERPVPAAAHPVSRLAQVDAFLVACNHCPELPLGSKVFKRHIWRAAGHTHPRQFQYWQSGREEATEEDDRNFRRIISMPPGEFLAHLQKKGILQ